MRRTLLCLLLVFVGFQASCQGSGTKPIAIDPASAAAATSAAARIALRQAELSRRDRFEVAGGLGIWTDEQTLSARLSWQQLPDRTVVSLSGPLNMGNLLLLDEDGQATLTRGNTVISRGVSADEVLQQGLGLAAPVPVTELRHWIRGLPGRADSVVHDEEGKLASLRYTDTQGTHWQARFRQYAPWDGLQVPSLITASGGPYSLRLVLKNWQSASTSAVPVVPESNNRLPIPGR
jgi:outer membrane lipoprotein LolB